MFIFSDIHFHTQKDLKHFATKSSEIIIAFRKAGSALQKRVLLYKKQNKNKSKSKKKEQFFLMSLMMLNFVIQGLYDTQYTICDYTAMHRNTTRVCQYKNYK
jgi:hypothetical protein